MNMLIPQADTIPVAWGWFQFLLLLTFPLHLLAMNAMLGCVGYGVFLHFRGRAADIRLAHRLAVALPLVIAVTVNFGVAPLLFVQVLYGQFIYTSSVLMGIAWISIIPLLIIAYYGAYLYDFRFSGLGKAGAVIGLLVLAIFLLIAWIFSSNMQLMTLPEQFHHYFQHMDGSFLLQEYAPALPRYLHAVCGSLAVGGLFVVLFGRIQQHRDEEMAGLATGFGQRTFLLFTSMNVLFGLWYLLALPKAQMLLFMGGNLGATVVFVLALLLTAGALFHAYKQHFWSTFLHAVLLVVVMTFLRAWLRSSYLQQVFSLDQLQVVPEYSPMIFFFVTLLFGLACLVWLLMKTRSALKA